MGHPFLKCDHCNNEATLRLDRGKQTCFECAPPGLITHPPTKPPKVANQKPFQRTPTIEETSPQPALSADERKRFACAG